MDWKDRKQVNEYKKNWRIKNKDVYKLQTKRWRYSKNKRCIDCGILICNSSIRCEKHKNLVINFKEIKICAYCKKPFIEHKHCNRVYCSRQCYVNGRLLYNKGKKLEDLFGKGKADKIVKKISETRIRLGLANGEKNPMFGKKHNKKTKQKMREKRLGFKHTLEARKKMSRPDKKNPFYGKTHSFESKKKMSCIKRGISLKEWDKFISFNPYPSNFDNIFRKKIKMRDGYTCQMCNLYKEDLNLLKRRLCVHHINYDKTLTIPQNCITICNKCHSITNGNRNHWKTFFQSLLKEKYNYEYTEDQKIILDFIKKEGISDD